jgi:hypothetical protein
VSADYFLLGSLLVILTSPIIGHLIDKKRLSPTLFLSLQTILMLGIGVTCLIYPSLYFFLALEVARNLTSGSLYHPSYQMILSSFVETYRNRLQSFYNFYYFAVVGISLIVLFSFTTYLFPSIERTFLLWLVLFSMLFIFGITFLLKKKWCDLLYAFIQSKHKAASIIAVHALSFVRPKNFDQRMEKLLTLEPKKLLRKTIILGLGYSTKGSTTERIIREFRSEKEEIQIAVLDALRASHHYKGIQFMLNLLMGQERPKSIRVRIHATLMIAAIYGKKAIPFLLNGLQDQDFRVVANTLETLSIYRDKKLIPHFERFVDSQDLRVCANALMGLAYFRKTKKMYREGVCKILTGGDLRHISSILYVIGKLKDHRFKNEVDALAKTALIEEVAVIPSLTWTWIRWRDPRGFDLAGKFLGMPHQKNVQRPFMHFFSQLSAKDRFDLIQYLAIEHRSQPSFLKNLGDNLRHTSFDFHEEIEYLDLVRIG